MSIVIAVDVMSGDYGIAVVLPACIKFLIHEPNANLLLMGDSKSINLELKSHLAKGLANRIDIINSTQIVAMDEDPTSAMRSKKDSSMRIAINWLHEKKAAALVSAGNTGALMAMSHYVLRTIAGIDRPAIAKIMPTSCGEMCILDLGANLLCQAQNLLQFAVMGAALIEALNGKNNPSIGLLNIGTEETKGTELIKTTATLLKNSHLNFSGNVEGNEIFKGIVDVVVTDGFTGNICLKTTEGVAKMISSFVREEFSRTFVSKLMAACAAPVLKNIKKRVDHNRYNGAVLLGLTGVVVKSHGSANSEGFYYALYQAYHEASSNVTQLIINNLNSLKLSQ